MAVLLKFNDHEIVNKKALDSVILIFLRNKILKYKMAGTDFWLIIP